MVRNLLILVALLFATTVRAQERLAFLVAAGDGDSQSMLELDVGVSQFGMVRALTPVPRAPGDNFLSIPFALAGGRYVVWVSAGWEGNDAKWLQIFDRQTRTTTLAGPTGPVLESTIRSDPRRPRVFSLGSLVGRPLGTESVYVYDAATGLSRGFFPSSPGGPVVRGFTYAAESDQLIAWRAAGNFGVPSTYDIAVLDVASGTIVRTFPIPELLSTLSVTRDGRRLYTYSGVGPAPIVAYDLTTGQEIARSAPLTIRRPLTLDEQRGLVLVPLRDSREIVALDATTLATVATRRAADSGQDFAIYPGRGMTGAYVFRAGPASQTCPAAIDALAPDGSVRNSVDIAAVTGGLRPIYCGPSMAVLLRSPFAPEPLTATVNGHTVSLSWESPGDVSGFELQVGLTPGTTLMRVPLDFNTTAVTYDGVPPGVYYARVKAFNEIGAGPSSNELRIEVR